MDNDSSIIANKTIEIVKYTYDIDEPIKSRRSSLLPNDIEDTFTDIDDDLLIVNGL